MKTKAKRAPEPKIIEAQHGRYLIKAGLLQNVFVARAFPKPPSKFRHLVAEASGDSAEVAIAQLVEKLETLRAEQRAERRADPMVPSGIPTRDEYADALRSISPGPKLLAVLHDHALSRRRGLPLKKLASGADFASVDDFLRFYDRLGSAIAAVIEPDDMPPTGRSIVLTMTGYTVDAGEDAATLQPELQDALLHLLGDDRRDN